MENWAPLPAHALSGGKPSCECRGHGSKRALTNGGRHVVGGGGPWTAPPGAAGSHSTWRRPQRRVCVSSPNRRGAVSFAPLDPRPPEQGAGVPDGEREEEQLGPRWPRSSEPVGPSLHWGGALLTQTPRGAPAGPEPPPSRPCWPTSLRGEEHTGMAFPGKQRCRDAAPGAGRVLSGQPGGQEGVPGGLKT